MPNAFAASALMMALSTLLVTMHVDFVIQLGKDTVVCLAGARSITTVKKKDTVVCLLGARYWQLRPEKKDTVVCLADAR